LHSSPSARSGWDCLAGRRTIFARQIAASAPQVALVDTLFPARFVPMTGAAIRAGTVPALRDK
jgi:hypothetical protein